MERPRFELMSSFSNKEQTNEKESSPKIGSMKEFLLRLKETCPNFTDTELADFQITKPLFKGMSPEKRVHARDVSLRVARMFPESDVVLGALLHDTQEQTPKEYALMEKLLPENVAQFVRALSEDPAHVNREENAPLAHLKAVFPTLSSEMKNRLILIKLADRLDNLQKRLEDGTVPKAYRKKSLELVMYLESEFKPDAADPLNELQLRQLKNELVQLLKSPKQRKNELKKAA